MPGSSPSVGFLWHVKIELCSDARLEDTNKANLMIIHFFFVCQAEFNISKVVCFQISPLEESGIITWREDLCMHCVPVNYPQLPAR